jgi:hypothetical protein
MTSYIEFNEKRDSKTGVAHIEPPSRVPIEHVSARLLIKLSTSAPIRPLRGSTAPGADLKPPPRFHMRLRWEGSADGARC